MKKNLKSLPASIDNPQEAIDHNLSAFQRSVAFGMHNRMEKILYPLRTFIENKKQAKILIIGPRTEDDIFMCKALGMHNCIGLDLITYSPLIKLGDAHNMDFKNEEFDAVVLGWVIAYSINPNQLANEVQRVTKPGGLICVAWEWSKEEDLHKKEFNQVNSIDDHASLFAKNNQLVLVNDPIETLSLDKCIILRTPNVG